MEKASKRPNRSLRIAIVSENFLPKVDGVTRTLARLLEHLQLEGHEALVLGPKSGMTSYAGHEVIGTKGIPLLGVYKGLKLNFIRPRFIRRLLEFKPDVIQFVDPIWLCAQCIPAIQYYLPDTPLLSSYHTNLAMYATLFGFSWLTPWMWNLQRNLHGRCELTYCPSPSTMRMLNANGFQNVRLWPRGVDTGLFRPEARDMDLRRSWSAEAPLLSSGSSTPTRRSSLDEPSYSPSRTSSSSKIVLLYVGRISWEKNLRLLVEAARGLQEPSEDGKRPACQLVFVGDGPSRQDLENLCASYGLGAVFMGYRKGEELASCYASADIFAFPSWTETFGQVVLESLASGLPVVGLRAEGVCDLVKHEETGLLLDLDDLLPTTSAAEIKEKVSDAPPSYKEATSSTTDFKPLPENPNVFFETNSQTFPLAVSMYRDLLVDLATNHERRRAMGDAAAKDAAKRSWHGAMEMLVDGYREIAKPVVPRSPSSLALSRSSTIEVDVVEHVADSDTYAESTAADSTAKRRGVGRVLRLGGVFRRTGGRLREGSISQPIRTWLGRRQGVTEVVVGEDSLIPVKEGDMWATRERFFIYEESLS
ncbi:UDP-Glycosyltransferase/glycogen phosphorylase [Meredithblackwellia eburnea MCA 4105]